jgi:hypothetical protein
MKLFNQCFLLNDSLIACQCYGRKLRKSVRSVGSLIMTGLRVRGQYQRITNATEGDR